jgi:ribose 5-phosphate isomerase
VRVARVTIFSDMILSVKIDIVNIRQNRAKSKFDCKLNIASNKAGTFVTFAGSYLLDHEQKRKKRKFW